MATSSEDFKLGEDLESFGKMLKAMVMTDKIARETTRTIETLRLLRIEAAKIDNKDPHLRQIAKALDGSIEIGDGLSRMLESMGKKHLECVKVLKKMDNSSEITPEQVNTMTTNCHGIVQLCEEFAKSIGKFIKSLNYARDLAEKKLSEAKREEERLKREAAGARSAAKRKSVGLWLARIGTLGLITFNSKFQEAAVENDEKHKEANRLGDLEQRFHKAHQALDQMARGIDRMKEHVQSGPIKLTEVMIAVIRNVLQMYEQLTQMKQKDEVQREMLQMRENTIEEQKGTIAEQQAALSEKEAENAQLRERLAELEAAQKNKNA